MQIFRDLPHEEIQARLNRAWDFRYFVPIPKFRVRCPQCDSHEVHLSRAHFFKRDKRARSKFNYRVDLYWKCTVCSHLFIFGIPCPEEMWPGRGDTYEWREIQERLNESGHPDYATRTRGSGAPR